LYSLQCECTFVALPVLSSGGVALSRCVAAASASLLAAASAPLLAAASASLLAAAAAA
jgi:hypothetical protein